MSDCVENGEAGIHHVIKKNKKNNNKINNNKINNNNNNNINNSNNLTR